MPNIDCITRADCLEYMRSLPEGCVDAVIADPPFNIGVRGEAWDKIEHYAEWSLGWIQAALRVLKPNGVFYMFGGHMAEMCDVMSAIKRETDLVLKSFITWHKPDFYRHAYSGKGLEMLRCHFPVTEYIAHYHRSPKVGHSDVAGGFQNWLKSAEGCWTPLIDWFDSECKRLGYARKDLAEMYEKKYNRKPYMFRHWFCSSQFGLPVKAIWDDFFVPLGFGKDSEALRKDYEALRKDYEALRKDYEALRPFHDAHPLPTNIVTLHPPGGSAKIHICQKPEALIGKLIESCTRPGDTILDPFAGSGVTLRVANRLGRHCYTCDLTLPPSKEHTD